MKRFHVHVGVADLEQSIRFYSGLFGAEPSVRKTDYAKWMIDEPRVNFAISKRSSGRIGVNHLGLQAESADELASLRERFEAADASSIVDEPGVHCCYAKGDKHWVTDPQGIAWEAFHTLASVPFYHPAAEGTAKSDACCADETNATSDGCCAPAESDAKSNGCCAPATVATSHAAATPLTKQTTCCA